MPKRVPRAKPVTQAASKPATKAQREEAKLLAKLFKRHRYAVLPMKRPIDRYQYRVKLATGAGRVDYAMLLVVPQDSALGLAMIASDKLNDRCATRRARRRARSK